MPKRLLIVCACAALAASPRAAEFAARSEPLRPQPKAVDPGALAPSPLLPAALPDAAVPALDAPAIAPAIVDSALIAGAAPVRPAAPELVPAQRLTPAWLDRFFDRRPANPDSETSAVRHPLREEVRRLAAPWRTERQVAKLAETPRAAGETFKFTVIGDAEPGRFWLWRALFNVPGIFSRLLSDAEKKASDFTVQLGDMVSRGTVRNFIEFFRDLAALAPAKPYLTVIGNHDRRNPHGESDSRLYRSLFGRTDYFFDHGGIRFVTVDSSAGKITPQQLRWLDQALDTKLRKIVFTHIPPAVIRPWGKDGGRKEWGGFKNGDVEFTELVARRGVSRVYMGHIHGLRFKDYLGVRYVISGGGGSPLYPGGLHNNFHHYITVEVTPDGLRETIHRADGNSYSIP